jgi:hypothetical protein
MLIKAILKNHGLPNMVPDCGITACAAEIRDREPGAVKQILPPRHLRYPHCWVSVEK